MSAPISSLSSSLPAVDFAHEPESIRHGDTAAKQAYATGLGFEQMLLSQLTKQMTDTISGSGAGGDGLGGDSSDGSSDAPSSNPLAGAYSSLLPGALTQGVMAGGDNALAMQIAQSIDPALLSSGHRSRS